MKTKILKITLTLCLCSGLAFSPSGQIGLGTSAYAMIGTMEWNNTLGANLSYMGGGEPMNGCYCGDGRAFVYSVDSLDDEDAGGNTLRKMPNWLKWVLIGLGADALTGGAISATIITTAATAAATAPTTTTVLVTNDIANKIQQVIDLAKYNEPKPPPNGTPETLTIMTYNLETDMSLGTYDKHAEVISSVSPDIISLQEVRLDWNINRIKTRTGLCGVVGRTFMGTVLPGGNALLWNTAKVGSPDITFRYIYTPKSDFTRNYIIAEFCDFYVIATHLATTDKEAKNPADFNKERRKMAERIMAEDFIQNYRKPVYIAGDMNSQPHDSVDVIQQVFAKKFVVLNDTTKEWNVDKSRYEYLDEHGTTWKDDTGWMQIDLILGHRQNPNNDIIERGKPASIHPTDGQYREWFQGDGAISDHRPYFVKVKLK